MFFFFKALLTTLLSKKASDHIQAINSMLFKQQIISVKIWINKQYKNIKSLDVSNSVSNKQIYLLLSCKPEYVQQQAQWNLTQIYSSYYYSKNDMVIVILSMHSVSQQFWVSQIHTCMPVPKSSITVRNYCMFHSIPNSLDFIYICLLLANDSGNELLSSYELLLDFIIF